MGGMVSQLWWGGDPDVVNAVSGLSKRDVYAVQKSWAPANADPVGTGTELFTRLFRADPETKEFFKMLRNVPESQFRTNHQFKAHVINLVSSFNLAVVNLHQPEVVVAMMNKLGESHGKRKIKEKHFHVKMGGWLSYLWWGGDPDVVNAQSGLTRREVYAVQQSWAPVYANSVANGTELLRRLFRAYPETKEFFKMVRKSSEEDYSQNPQFKAHVINLMSSINLAVNNLNQPEIVAAMMNKLGESHGRRKIQKEHFYDLKDVIVKMFIEVLKLEGSTLAAWGKTMDFWYKHIFESLSNGDTR